VGVAVLVGQLEIGCAIAFLNHGTHLSRHYDEIGATYASRRRADPRIAARIDAALGDARSVVNVGAGTGNYEPADRDVIAIEPSGVMAAQRPPHLPPAIEATAESLPLADDSVDAAMAVLTIHHWTHAEAGVRELQRVARDRIVIVTVDIEVSAHMWLFADYFPEVAERDRAQFPAIETLLAWLGPAARSEVVPVPRDCSDGFLLSFWSDPERVLDPEARAATSGFALLDRNVEADAVARLAADLESGAWDERHGRLRQLAEYDAGLRLIAT
jgi:SAM-dependent methyltransferase